jgi:hypothetical protein
VPVAFSHVTTNRQVAGYSQGCESSKQCALQSRLGRRLKPQRSYFFTALSNKPTLQTKCFSEEVVMVVLAVA